MEIVWGSTSLQQSTHYKFPCAPKMRPPRQIEMLMHVFLDTAIIIRSRIKMCIILNLVCTKKCHPEDGPFFVA